MNAAWKPTGQVVIGNDHKPYLMSQGQTFARTGDGGWHSVSLSQPLFVGDRCRICTPEEALLYGVIDGDPSAAAPVSGAGGGNGNL